MVCNKQNKENKQMKGLSSVIKNYLFPTIAAIVKRTYKKHFLVSVLS
jgi:hypothetical protein